MEKIWSERRFADFWSLNHFLFGATLPFVMRFVGFGLKGGLLAALSLCVAWELVELITKEEEKEYNGILDVLLALAGFLLFWRVDDPLILLFAIILFVLLELFAFGTRLFVSPYIKIKILSAIYIFGVISYLGFYIFLLKIL